MTLESIREALAQCQCQWRCLENIDDLDMLGLHYKVWDSKSYSEQGTWNRGILEAAKVRYIVKGQERVKFQLKIGGLVVCNKCYGVAVGYSERHFKRLTGAVRAGCVAAIHGNSQRIYEGTCTSAARALLEQYIAGAGCSQPHRDIKRLCDGAFRTLVLLPMNTCRIDVFDMVNEKIRLLGPGNKISRGAFYRLWREEFTHVKIPPIRSSQSVTYAGNTKIASSPSQMNVLRRPFKYNTNCT